MPNGNYRQSCLRLLFLYRLKHGTVYLNIPPFSGILYSVYFLALLGVGLTDKQSVAALNVDFRAVISVLLAVPTAMGTALTSDIGLAVKISIRYLYRPSNSSFISTFQIYGVDHGPVKTIRGGKKSSPKGFSFGSVWTPLSGSYIVVQLESQSTDNGYHD